MGGIPNSLSEVLQFAGIVIFLTTTISALLAIAAAGRTNMPFLGVQLILLFLCLYASSSWSHLLIFNQIIANPEVFHQVVSTLLFLAIGFTIDMSLMAYLWRGALIHGGQDAFPRLLVVVVRILIYLVITLLILQFVYDQSITALATLSGAFALILGLSAQTTLGEMFAGIAIALSRPFSVGDWVKVGNLDEGRVLDMTWRLVRIQTRDRNVINVPNRVVADSAVRNFSRPSQVTRISDTIYFSAETNPLAIQELLLDAIGKAQYVLSSPAPNALYRGQKDGVAEFWMRYYIDDYRLKDDVTENVWKCVVEHVARSDLRIELPRRHVEIWREFASVPRAPS